MRRARGADRGRRARRAVGDRAAALGQLEAGRAALDAGAVEPGVACLRQACAEARAVGDPALLARVLATLGVALVHAVRGRDEEGAAVLHEALALAEEHGERDVAAKVCRELGYVEVQAGRGVSAGRWLMRASELVRRRRGARRGPRRARHGALATARTTPPAIRLLESSVAIARGCGDERRAAWSLAILGRAHLSAASSRRRRRSLEGSLALVRATGWIAFQPFPEALRAEVALRRGDTAHAAAAARARVAARLPPGRPLLGGRRRPRPGGSCTPPRGETTAALARLREAAIRAVRVADPYVWIHAYCLDALAGVEIEAGAPEAPATVALLESLAARDRHARVRGARALHRAALGDGAALDSARLLAEAIDNPDAARRPRRRGLTRTRGVTRPAGPLRAPSSSAPHRPRSDSVRHTVPDSELKARHRAMWASGDYPSMVETFLTPLGPRLVEACRIGPGLRVLDVAAGTGNAAIPAARAAPTSSRATSRPSSSRPAAAARPTPASSWSGWRPTPSTCRSTTPRSTSSSRRSA